MRTYLADIIPRLKQYSKQLDDLTLLTNQHWVSLGDISDTKKVFIFRKDNKLIISENGIVQKGSWEYLGNHSLLLETKEYSFLLKHGFFDENVIALKLDSTEKYAFLVNETKYEKELNTLADIIKFLHNKYETNSSSSNINIKFSYSIVEEFDDFDWVSGKRRCYKISYSDGSIYIVYKGYKSGKYYYYNIEQRITYCNGLEDAIIKMWHYHKK